MMFGNVPCARQQGEGAEGVHGPLLKLRLDFPGEDLATISGASTSLHSCDSMASLVESEALLCSPEDIENLCVKNTFLDFPAGPSSPSDRRARSCPAVVSGFREPEQIPTPRAHRIGVAVPHQRCIGIDLDADLSQDDLLVDDLPSAGSIGHEAGTCKPCVFYHTKGCANGSSCTFCHLCDAQEKRRRRLGKPGESQRQTRMRRERRQMQRQKQILPE